MASASSDRVPKRILIDVSPFSDYRDEAFDDPDKVIDIALSLLKRKGLIPAETQNNQSDVKLVIKLISRYDTKVIFDLFHDTFDAARAHLYGQDPPVCIVSMRHGKREKAYPANRSQELKVDFEIRFLHNRYGTGCKPPFSEDSRQGSVWSIPSRISAIMPSTTLRYKT
ncbi:hypothetical protein ISF_03720 [Cordyceps fumosorosea ARSEF 2679]|uniref:Uncharacterized protein n=1 Tax=Cordyceps fumosorosea (strain ARSEF 2679) TaxID=1081104 RepID=A0A167ZI16_CORFA|nr:hypothetical protein ISF_03720 [Cordyceps fumosorosea ARSEF 2679]OAA67544.1 hypothetical protein ISF_03720 [Cordyceps fumosorosea ARSEF 2679]